ncbi:sensor histidine kinase [Salipiger marinus]|uniref:histidine kinase n=1 Tax=Salipiger marinus TaxID=555512 RepID=A0A1G8R6Z0_9RHOB|nr:MULTISPECIES: histidine kinase dimerization/phosphoacceptor domain -containing protein [Salipiger]MCD1619272.1 sensor histidine kinase [Salipiger manganoxidans]MEB3419315.1 histidine kinase dimerization/phosphoacceptor domain -containing protein [Salipiger manganoxidans]SDJ12742.1 Two-component sensor histidine kinase, contains HisKA and HATPase domains [Salipiger marinus]
MTGTAGVWRLRPTGLAARIILFLSLALVPIGVVAYFQTTKLAEETRLRSQLSLVALTETAALGERETILRAQGGAQAIGATLGQSLGDRADCSRRLASYLTASPGYSFAAIMTRDGTIVCNSMAIEMRIEDYPRLAQLVDTPGATAWLNPQGPMSGRSVIVVAQPFFLSGALAGHVLLSVPSTLLPRGQNTEVPADFEELITINENGEILSARDEFAQVEDLLPADLDLQSLIGAKPQSFAARSADGETRVYASAPLVPGMIHALGIWSPQNAEAQAISVGGLAMVAVALPLLMWAASVVVAFLAVNRLVIRHIHRLSRRMRAFALSRRVPDARDGAMPAELADMEDDFLDMADAILRDEALQENALREKTILLKEVHHRVKNNLQLISSIMNMQIRQSRNDETRAILHRLQDRVRSLATIHRNLYQTEDLGHVNAGVLLKDMVAQMSQVANSDTDVSVEAEDIEAVPDQAVPLSLLTAEALTNATKYAGPGADGRIAVRVVLRREPGRRALLEVVNTGDSEAVAQERRFDGEPAGLGSKLMQAFAMQLGGQLEQGPVADGYRVAIRFALEEFIPDPSVPDKVPNVPNF